MENENRKQITDLNLQENDKMLLTFLIKPRSTTEVLAKLSEKEGGRIRAYSHVHSKLSVWNAMGYVSKIKPQMGAGVLWQLNQKNLQP